MADKEQHDGKLEGPCDSLSSNISYRAELEFAPLIFSPVLTSWLVKLSWPVLFSFWKSRTNPPANPGKDLK